MTAIATASRYSAAAGASGGSEVATRPTAIDLFAGAGGATQGLKDAGFEVLGAVENDAAASESFALNHPEVHLWEDDIRRVSARSMLQKLDLEPRRLTLLKACPPCQGFSSLAEGRAEVNAKQNDLVKDTIRFVRALMPNAVMIENVPGLGRDIRAEYVLGALKRLGYSTNQYRVDAADFGVPQRRKRLIILARRGKNMWLPPKMPADSPKGFTTVEGAFAALESAWRGKVDPLGVSRKMSDIVSARIAAVPINGTRFDLPEHLQLACHKKPGLARNATASYGRVRADGPAPTMTTRCTTPACGSFIHPTENRGLTLREAATLQTFPHGYHFAGSYGSIERQIGNAVPVLMAARLGEAVLGLVHGKSPSANVAIERE